MRLPFKLPNKLPCDAWDVLLVTGTALVVSGLWWIYPPAALIVGGMGLAGFAWWGDR